MQIQQRNLLTFAIKGSKMIASLFRVMGASMGSNPAAAASLIMWMLVSFLLGFLKVIFTTLAATPSGVEKEGTPMISKINKSDSFAAAFFDTMHAICVGAVAVVAVP